MRDVLDMRTGGVYVEDLDDPDGEMADIARTLVNEDLAASTLLALMVNTAGVATRGGPFSYRSLDTEVLGRVLERASGRSLPYLLRDELLDKLGLEQLRAGAAVADSRPRDHRARRERRESGRDRTRNGSRLRELTRLTVHRRRNGLQLPFLGQRPVTWNLWPPTTRVFDARPDIGEVDGALLRIGATVLEWCTGQPEAARRATQFLLRTADAMTSESRPSGPSPPSTEESHLVALGYSGTDFHRSMGLAANLALGFTYLSPLVGVYSLLAYSLSLGGPPAIWWIVIVGAGQFMVALVFGEVVSQFPLAGGIYPWCRRLWGRKYAWVVSWVYLWAVIVTVTSVAEFSSGFIAALFGIEATREVALVTAVSLLLLAMAFNYSGTHMLARVAQIGLFAELVGVIALGLYLLIFQRENSFSVFFDSMGAGGNDAYIVTFFGASLAGLFLFYGFEACGGVAEEVADPTRRIPQRCR